MRLVEFFEATVYHGSSHTFRKFNVRKAGTGEGFDAFGYGTYFSEHPDVAKFYSVMGGEPNRNVYTVEIQDDIIDKMLDWDKQLQHQSPYVQERLSSLPEIDPRFGIPREEWFKYMEKGNITGQQVYGGLGLRKKLSKKQVSSVLLKLGIPGIKYLDAVSREDGSEVETRNIVLFDTRYARIMDRKTVTEAVAYHGSPHKFGEFDIQKIGSGQGAQTYGWGLYFAEEPTVAKSYYDELTRTKRGSVLVRGKETNYKDPAVALAIGAMNWGGDPLENLTKITPGKLYTPDVIRKAAKIIKAGKTSYEAPGAVYTVEIPDQVVAQMLSWDHPLSAQKSVVAAIPRTREGHKGLHIFPSKAGDILYLGNEELGQLDALDGRQLMDFLQQVVGPKGASKHLLSMGIPGLKFLDQHSRTKGHGTHNFVMFDDKHVKIVDTVSESHLTEGASPVLYHYTTVTNLEPILQNNEFSMATSYGTGAETPHDVKGAPYYLSTTRHKLGAYHSTGANYSVMLVLDGAALAQRYKIKPVDYWDAGPERSESEDRVFSREQTIPNASKYIKEIHMITEDPDRTSFSSDVVRRMTRRLLINAKKRGVPIYLYRDSKAWLLQDKRKALPISQALDQPEEKAGKRYSSMRTNWFKPWIELYHKRTAEELSPEAARLLRNLRYDDYNGEVTRRLLNTVHNDKRSPNVVALIDLMKKNRLSTVADYTALLKKKWGISESRLNELANAQSPQFRQWFGKSKVVDAQGRPLMCYHATSSSRQFGGVRGLSHFGTLGAAEEFAGKEGSRMFPVYLQIENPLLIEDAGDPHDSWTFAGMIADPAEVPDNAIPQTVRMTVLSMTKQWEKIYHIDKLWAPPKEGEAKRLLQLIRYLMKRGYDGFVYENEVEDAGSMSWIPFRSNQIKYAYSEGES